MKISLDAVPQNPCLQAGRGADQNRTGVWFLRTAHKPFRLDVAA
jgi:hypothetical protein